MNRKLKYQNRKILIYINENRKMNANIKILIYINEIISAFDD